MCWPLRFDFGMGVVLINVSQVCLKSLPNFHSENLAAIHLIFVAKILQRFTSNASQRAKCNSHQAFNVRIRQWGCPIFTAKIQQSFTFGALQRTSRVSHLCIQCILTGSYCDEPKPFKALSMLRHVTYTRKPMLLGDMDQDNHTTMIVHTIQPKYAPTAIALSTYPHYKVKSSHERGAHVARKVHHTKCTVTHIQVDIYIYIYTSCTMLSHRAGK